MFKIGDIIVIKQSKLNDEHFFRYVVPDVTKFKIVRMDTHNILISILNNQPLSIANSNIDYYDYYRCYKDCVIVKAFIKFPKPSTFEEQMYQELLGMFNE